MRIWQSISLMVAPLMLAACGGSDGAVNSVSNDPPPPVVTYETVVGAPLPLTPALVTGSYDTIGIEMIENAGEPRILAPSDLRIGVDSAAKRYTLTFDPAAFPNLVPSDGKLVYTIDDERYGHDYQTITYVDGVQDQTEAATGDSGSGYRPMAEGEPRNSKFTSILGLSHVSLGYWSWDAYDPSWDDCVDPVCQGSVAFVYGDRTPPSAIPASGTATYTTASATGCCDDVTLTADFGAKSISADVQYSSFQFNGCYCNHATGYIANLSGSSPIQSSGDFDIMLNGTTQTGGKNLISQYPHEYSPFEPDSDPVPAKGTLSGAFFGPDASQIGAVLEVPRPDGTVMTGAIAAKNN